MTFVFLSEANRPACNATQIADTANRSAALMKVAVVWKSK